MMCLLSHSRQLMMMTQVSMYTSYEGTHSCQCMSTISDASLMQEGMAAQADAEASSATPEAVSPAAASASCDTDAQVAAEPASSGAAGYASLDSGSASQSGCSSQEASGTATTSQQVGNVSMVSQKLHTILNSQPGLRDSKQTLSLFCCSRAGTEQGLSARLGASLALACRGLVSCSTGAEHQAGHLSSTGCRST